MTEIPPDPSARDITAPDGPTSALQGPPVVVECRLSGGAKTLCVAITVKQAPTTVAPGPWCPRQISDGADKGGIWLDQGQVHAVDGSFIARLASFYKDAAWQMFDVKTGAVKVTDSREACDSAAQSIDRGVPGPPPGGRPAFGVRRRGYSAACVSL